MPSVPIYPSLVSFCGNDFPNNMGQTMFILGNKDYPDRV